MRIKLLIAALFGVLGVVAPLTSAQAVEPYEYANPSAMTTKALILDVAEIGDRLVAAGEYGHIIYSDDRGENWVQAQNVPTRNTLTKITFVDDKTGFAVGHDATILKTEDGGESWSLKYIERRGENPLFGLQFSSATYGVAVGAFSTVMETKDGGETWTQRPLIEGGYDDFHLNGLFTDAAGHLYIPAEFGVVYKSVDGGRTFEGIQTAYEGSFWGGMALANNDLLIWGMRGNAYVSNDGGRNWVRSETNTDRSISGGTQLTDGTIVLTGLSGLVLVSKNNGRNFDAIVRPDRLSFATVSSKSDAEVLLYGDPGVLPHALTN
jgi:photosystem II stability/assembly factor-like uncharacterized protein